MRIQKSLEFSHKHRCDLQPQSHCTPEQCIHSTKINKTNIYNICIYIVHPNEPELVAVLSPPPPLVPPEFAVDALLWLLHREPGKCSNFVLSIASLDLAEEEIQMSAQDPSLTQAPVKVASMRLRGTDMASNVSTCMSCWSHFCKL